jgi:Protein of unknown function (DUF2911)
MKKNLLVVASALIFATACTAQDKSKRPSPPAITEATLSSGAIVKIDYSSPSVKGRVIGKDLEPKEGEIWRTGANEATIFEVSKDVMIEGKTLPAGKYSLFSIVNGSNWTLIFNKTWKQWGAYNYKQADDAIRVNVKGKKAASFAEKFSLNAKANGEITILWGDYEVDFMVK